MSTVQSIMQVSNAPCGAQCAIKPGEVVLPVKWQAGAPQAKCSLRGTLPVRLSPGVDGLPAERAVERALGQAAALAHLPRPTAGSAGCLGGARMHSTI